MGFLSESMGRQTDNDGARLWWVNGDDGPLGEARGESEAAALVAALEAAP